MRDESIELRVQLNNLRVNANRLVGFLKQKIIEDREILKFNGDLYSDDQLLEKHIELTNAEIFVAICEYSDSAAAS